MSQIPPAEDEAQVIRGHRPGLEQFETILPGNNFYRLNVANSPERVSRLERRVEGDVTLHHCPVHSVGSVGEHPRMLVSDRIGSSEEGVSALERTDVDHVDADEDVNSALSQS